MINGDFIYPICVIGNTEEERTSNRDSLMVEYEQNKLQEITNSYFTNNQIERNNVMKDINDAFNGVGIGGFITGLIDDPIIGDIIEKEFTEKNIPYDQDNINHRILLGKKLVERLNN